MPVSIRFLGTAAFEIVAAGGQHILIDPYLDDNPADIILLHIGTNDITHGEGSAATDVENILNEIECSETEHFRYWFRGDAIAPNLPAVVRLPPWTPLLIEPLPTWK